ncbi:MAG: hypothetical protein O3C40_13840 [Planctomycetota bacterium]|nr:hypothetical protein [Planctomycetota bacterium]
MVKTTVLTICVALLVLAATVNAQEKKPPVPAAPPTPALIDLAAPTAFPGGIDIAAEMKKQMDLRKATLKKLIEEHGKDSIEVRNAQQSLREMERFAKQALQFSTPGGVDPAALAPLTLGTSRAEMMLDFLRSMSVAGGPDHADPFGSADPLRTAMQGLEFELKSLAAEIHSTKDEAAKSAKSEELREIAETVVVLRTRYRQKSIKAFEERLAALKAEDEGDSVDSLIARLLQTNEKPEGDEPKEKEKE